MLTLFCVLKPFTDPHISAIQHNALQSWRRVYGDVEILVFGDRAGVHETCDMLGITFVPGLRQGETGRDLMSDAFNRVSEIAQYDTLCYVNGDIILPPNFADVVRAIDCERYLGIGERWDTPLTEALTFPPGWWQHVSAYAREHGRSPGSCSMDYFVHKRGQFSPMPDIYAGSWYSDNYLVATARQMGIPVVDLTEVVFAIHQNHTHPGGLDAWSKGIESMQSKALLPDGNAYSIMHADARVLP